MAFLTFLLGLFLGWLILRRQQAQLQGQLLRCLQGLGLETFRPPLSSLSQLSAAIAQQQQRYYQLEQQLETWKQLLQNAPIGYLQVDEENQLLWCNAAARHLLNLPPPDPQHPRLLLELVRSYELDQLIDQTRFLQKPYQSEWTFHPNQQDAAGLPSQQVYPLRGYGIPLLEGEVGVFLENRQEALLLSQQRDRWASDVAHELKTPLTSIRLVAETLQDRLDPPLKNWVDRLLKEVVRLSNLVQDLLDLSQIETKSLHGLQVQPLNLVELVQSAWVSLEPLSRPKALKFQYEGPEELWIQGDATRIYRVLLNLLDNSIKYSPSLQIIQVRLHVQSSPLASSEEPMVHLEVIDAGPGFPAAAIPHVFERFYRVDTSRSRPAASESAASNSPRSGGSGLGLAIVRQIVEAHQGRVSASNHPQSGGAWMQIFLPMGLTSSLQVELKP